jgi:hypothetical protein
LISFIFSIFQKNLILFKNLMLNLYKNSRSVALDQRVFICLFLMWRMVLHYPSYCVRVNIQNQPQFRMCEMSDLVHKFTVFDNYVTWMMKELSLILVLMPFVGLRGVSLQSHRWKLLQDHSCCQGSHAENTLQTCDLATD